MVNANWMRANISVSIMCSALIMGVCPAGWIYPSKAATKLCVAAEFFQAN
jgi:hypothetical protein